MRLALLFYLLVFSFPGFSQHNYPIPPQTGKMLFYIQRNHNENTIVYDALFTKNGKLNPEKPIDVYWIRYQEDSTRKALKWIENKYAYGINWEKIPGDNDAFDVELVADEERHFTLKLIAPFKAVLLTKINGKRAVLDHLYIEADNSGFWPEVKYIELFGKHVKTGKPLYEKYIVND